MRADRVFRVPAARGVEAALATEPAGEGRAVQRGSIAIRSARARAPRRSTGCVGPRSCGVTPSEQLGHLGHQILRRGAPDGLAGHQDGVGIRCDLRRDLSPGLPQDPPGSVPLDGAAHAARGDDARTHPVPGARNTTTRLPCSGRPSSKTRAHLARAHAALARSDGEPSAALAAARREDRAAGAGAHPQTEAVASSRGGGCSAGRYACPWPSDAVPRGRMRVKAGSRRPRPRRVYGAASPQDKALDNRKSVKTPPRAGRVEKSPCYRAPRLPPGDAAPDPRAATTNLPEWVFHRCGKVLWNTHGGSRSLSTTPVDAWSHVLERARDGAPRDHRRDVVRRRARRVGLVRRRRSRSPCRARSCVSACSTTISR